MNHTVWYLRHQLNDFLEEPGISSASPPTLFSAFEQSLSEPQTAADLTLRPRLGPPAYSTLSPSLRRKSNQVSPSGSPFAANERGGGGGLTPTWQCITQNGHIIAGMVCFWPLGCLALYYATRASRPMQVELGLTAKTTGTVIVL